MEQELFFINQLNENEQSVVVTKVGGTHSQVVNVQPTFFNEIKALFNDCSFKGELLIMELNLKEGMVSHGIQ